MFQVDLMSRTPVYEQLITQLERYLLGGLMKAEDKMPSVRALSLELGVNPNTIQKAYGIMEQQHMTMSVPGRGVFIAPMAVDIVREKYRKQLSVLRQSMTELKLAGVTKEEMCRVVEEVYKGDEND